MHFQGLRYYDSHINSYQHRNVTTTKSPWLDEKLEAVGSFFSLRAMVRSVFSPLSSVHLFQFVDRKASERIFRFAFVVWLPLPPRHSYLMRVHFYTFRITGTQCLVSSIWDIYFLVCFCFILAFNLGPFDGVEKGLVCRPKKKQNHSFG